uniref:Carboxylesterase type B domain-containing protein n=1 Tax=Arcella intermedia TaxID=1963864 RepID=A0A6B2LNP1_9EUKA
MLLAVSLLVCLCLGACDEAVVQTKYGPVRGVVSEDHRAFLGIPYAAPPVGGLRWSKPTSPPSWEPVLPTQQFKPGCPQDCQDPTGVCPAQISEDCLYVNVYTPRLANLSTLQPVMVFTMGEVLLRSLQGQLSMRVLILCQQVVWCWLLLIIDWDSWGG